MKAFNAIKMRLLAEESKKKYWEEYYKSEIRAAASLMD